MEGLKTRVAPNERSLREVWTPERQYFANYFEQPTRKEALETIIDYTKSAVTNNLVLPENFPMADLLACRNHFLPRNFYNLVNNGDIDPRNLAATEILLPREQIPEKLSFEEYSEKYKKTRISPVITDPNNINPLIRERFPLWLQEIEQTYSKVNFAVLCQQIHSGNLQNFDALCNVLGYTDAKKEQLLKNLKKTLPESDFITNFENEESSLRDMLTKAITLAQKSPVEAVFIKNELAAGFGVVKLELEELEELLKVSNADELIEAYKDLLRNKILSKSPKFGNNQELENHIGDVFCEWKCLGIQKALEINKELSVQYIDGKMVATTKNLVNPINNQHLGNLVYPLGRIEPELHESLQIAKLMMMCQFGGTGFEREGVLEAIGRINSIPYSGVDLIKDSSGDINLLEFNMRTTGVTPSLLRVVMNYLKTGYLPIEYLTQNVAFLNCEDRDLLDLAFNLRQNLDLFGLDADFYSILTLLQECDKPIGQVIVSRSRGEMKVDFERRCEYILSTAQCFEGKNQITVYSGNHYQNA